MLDTKSRLMALEEQLRKEEIIAQKHKGNIWQDEKGRFNTYVGGRKVSSKDKEKLINKLFDYYMNDGKQYTFEELFLEWSETRVKNEKIAESTHARYLRVFNRHFKPIAKKLVALITIDELVDLMESEANEKNLTAKGIRDMKSIVKYVMNRANRHRMSKFSGIDVLNKFEVVAEIKPKQVYVDEKKEVFDEDETIKVMEYLEKSEKTTDLCLLFLFISGLRIGEAVALKHEDIQPDGTISVHRTETTIYLNNKTVRHDSEKPKTNAGIRTVFIPKSYNWLLTKLKHRNPFGEWVFDNGMGSHYSTEAVRDRLERVCDDLKIMRKSPHKIRKTYCSILLDNGIDNNFIISQVGHTKITTTERSYHRNRKTNAKKHQIIDAIPDFLGENSTSNNAKFDIPQAMEL